MRGIWGQNGDQQKPPTTPFQVTVRLEIQRAYRQRHTLGATNDNAEQKDRKHK